MHNQRSIHPTIENLSTMGYLNSIPRVLYTEQPGTGWSQFIVMHTLGFIHRTHQRRKLPSSTTEVIHVFSGDDSLALDSWALKPKSEICIRPGGYKIRG